MVIMLTLHRISAGGENFDGFMKFVESLVGEDFISFLKTLLDKVPSPPLHPLNASSDLMIQSRDQALQVWEGVKGLCATEKHD